MEQHPRAISADYLHPANWMAIHKIVDMGLVHLMQVPINHICMVVDIPKFLKTTPQQVAKAVKDKSLATYMDLDRTGKFPVRACTLPSTIRWARSQGIWTKAGMVMGYKYLLIAPHVTDDEVRAAIDLPPGSEVPYLSWS